jgi:hypothetical protein
MSAAVVGARKSVVHRVFWLTLGWGLVGVGALLLFVPIPVPLIGIMPLLIGLALLTTHSKPVRRRLQFARHRFEWLSHAFDRFAHRAPQMVKHMIRRTNPIAHVRLARMRAHRKD